MTTELIPAGPTAKEDNALKVAKSGDYLPRLQLFGSKSGACAEGKISIGNYGLARSGGDIEDLGDEVVIVICAARPKALQITDDNVLNYFDETLPEFERIKEQSTVKDSGCMYGPEYLVWVPSADTFATLFMGTKTMRRNARSVHVLLRKAAVLTSELIKRGKYAWHGPICQAYKLDVILPELAKIEVQINKFVGEKGSTIEAVGAAAGSRDT